mmetsp:Transcript_9223/g.14191  ORF Transcript_9223/g.14191 Transcript_9223/m.14191 type:complete len:92 (+) Transcript_9223:3250-3525(+)
MRVRWLAKQSGIEVVCPEGGSDKRKEAEAMGAKKGLEGYIHHKTAERYHGFLVYVSRTYDALVLYLKGLHLTLDSWRPEQDKDGWRTTNTV